jgi:hypothetical protein
LLLSILSRHYLRNRNEIVHIIIIIIIIFYMASAELYLTVIEEHKGPEVVASGTYNGILKKNNTRA